MLSFNSRQPIPLPTNFDYDHCHLTPITISLALLEDSRRLHTADVKIPSEPAGEGQRDDRGMPKTRERLTTEAYRMQDAKVKALPAAFLLGDL